MRIADKIKIDYAELRPNEQIPSHVQDTWELAYVVCGRGIRTIGDTTESFSDGEVILLPPGIIHQWVFDPDHTNRNGNIADVALFIPDALLSEIAIAFPDFTANVDSIKARTAAVTIKGKRKPLIQKLMKRLAKAESKEIRVIYFLSLLPLLGAGEDEDVVGHIIDPHSANNKADRLRIYCDCNFMKDINLKDAARHIGMNVSSFCKFFLKHFGCTFTEHVNRLRIKESCRQLQDTSDSIAEIAYSTGFTSVPYFNRVFRNQCGCTPSQYRHKLPVTSK